MEKKAKKNVILVEALNNIGGIENEVMTLLRHIKADVYAGIYDPNTTYPFFRKVNVKYFLKKKLPSVVNTLYLRHKFKHLDTKKYANCIYFGSHSMAAAKKGGGCWNIWYCNAPLRYVYDSYEDITGDLNTIQRFFFKIFAYFIRKDDQKCFENIDVTLVNSKNVGERIRKFYGSDNAIVVFPSVDTKKFRFKKQGDYYLICARLTPDKNVDLVIGAFQNMPSKKLVVVGDGPEREKIIKMVNGYNNISYVGPKTGSELRNIYGNCIAVVYVTEKEDFGIVPIEAMASGKPCIGSKDGGMKETIIHKKTGLLISQNLREVMAAVRWMTPERSLKMRRACEKRAKNFSEEEYIIGIKKHLK